MLEIVVPRELLNQEKADDFDDLIILVNGEEVDGNEVSSRCYRTLSIPLPPNTEEIEIIASLIYWGMVKPPPLTVATDKNDYESGESITVKDITCSFVDEDVIIEIIDPEREIYKKITVPRMAGPFSTSIVVEGEHPLNDTCTAKATYAGQSDTSTFVVPEFPMSIIIFATAVSLIFVTRFIPNLKIGSD